MRFNNFDKRIGKEICSFVLVGTMLVTVTAGRTVYTEASDDDKGYLNELMLGYYTDEDVKANREKIFDSIAVGGSEKAKTYGKKNSGVIIPKKIDR